MSAFLGIAHLYVVLVVGWALRRRLPYADALNTVVTELTMPALILATLLGRPIDASMARAVLAALFGLAGCLALAAVLAPRLLADPRQRGTFVLSATFCNTGFLGIPLAAALWGEGSAGLSTAVMVDSFTTTLLLNSVGVAIALGYATQAGTPDGPTSRFTLANLLPLLRSPLVLAVPVGLLLQAAPLPLAVEAPLQRGLTAVGTTTGVLVFLATGMRLSFTTARRFAPTLAVVSLVRFVAAPLLALGAASALDLTGEVRAQAVLEVAMPTAMMAPVIAARYGCDDALGPASVAITTALAPLAVAAWLLVLGGG